MFEIINEELRIKSCSISDLSEETKKMFVEQFKGDTVETLTLFYNNENDYITLNSDHEMFNLYLTLTECYLTSDYDTRELIKEEGNKYHIEAFKVLDNVIRQRNKKMHIEQASEIMHITGKMYGTPFWHNFEVIDIIQKSNIKNYDVTSPWFVYNFFMYGYIMGKREERAKRHKIFKQM